MNKEKRPLVISVAAVSGGGKTTITTTLNEKLVNSKALYFDDYIFDGPVDILQWIEDGANYDLWDLTPLIVDLQILLNENFDYILLDFPFAYKNVQLSKHIDFAIFIDTPLDIALARRIMRDFTNSSLECILTELKNYMTQGRRGYLLMLDKIKPNSNLIIDGSISVSDIVDEILEKVTKN